MIIVSSSPITSANRCSCISSRLYRSRNFSSLHQPIRLYWTSSVISKMLQFLVCPQLLFLHIRSMSLRLRYYASLAACMLLVATTSSEDDTRDMCDLLWICNNHGNLIERLVSLVFVLLWRRIDFSHDTRFLLQVKHSESTSDIKLLSVTSIACARRDLILPTQSSR